MDDFAPPRTPPAHSPHLFDHARTALFVLAFGSSLYGLLMLVLGGMMCMAAIGMEAGPAGLLGTLLFTLAPVSASAVTVFLELRTARWCRDVADPRGVARALRGVRSVLYAQGLLAPGAALVSSAGYLLAQQAFLERFTQ